MRIYRVFIALMLIALVTTVEGWAHRPVGIGGDVGRDLDHAIEIADIDVSQVIYREISATLPQVWMTFEGQAGEFLNIQLGVPEIERLEAYRPSVAVIGPGLPEAGVPFEFPAGLGGQVFTPTESTQSELFYEPFSDTKSWILGNLQLTLPENGQYFVVAYHPESVEGKLWVALGKREAFGADDVAKMPEWLKAVREFHEVSGQAPLINNAYIVLLGLLTSVAFGAWWILNR